MEKDVDVTQRIMPESEWKVKENFKRIKES
jgi:hypothetical protein